MNDWLERVLSVPVCILNLRLLARTPIHVAHFCGYTLGGALKHRIKELSQDRHSPPDLRHLARMAEETFSRRIVSPNARERPWVLGVPPGKVHLAPGEPFEFALALFGPACSLWPAWWAAAQEVRLHSGILGSAFDEPFVGCKPLREYIPELGAESSPALRLQFETPARLRERGQLIPPPADLSPIIRFGINALEAVWRQPAPHQVRERLEHAAQQVIVRARPWQHRVMPDIFSGGQGRLEYIAGGVEISAAPPELGLVLYAGALTHIGQHSAFGFGRYSLWSDSA